MKSVISHQKKGVLVLGFFLAILAILNSSVFAEWEVINPPYVTEEWVLSDIYFTSPSEGWAVGDVVGAPRGVLLHFSNR
jgi:hypothetical protein